MVVLSDTNFWKNLDMCSRIFEPVLKDLSVNDDMKGGPPGILYYLCLGLDKLYREPIDGLPEPTRRKLHALFMDRWNAFHTLSKGGYTTNTGTDWCNQMWKG